MKKSTNAWKRYGVLFMTGVLLAGTAAGTAVSNGSVVQAEEENRVTLNIAGDEKAAEDEASETEIETETETETEAEETYAPIDYVEADTNAIIATDVSGVVEDFLPAMVNITMKGVEQVDTYNGVEEYESEGAASGIIIAQNEEELLIATNSHVVKDMTDIQVWFAVNGDDEDQESVPGKVKGMDTDYELAVVAVQLSDIPEETLAKIKIATLGSSSDLKVGQTAIAVGNQLGYGQSVTCGVISALNRQNVLDIEVPLILMDTPLNFGSSGGAVLNAKGQVIGICLAKEVGENSESMAYAIPIDEAIPILERLANKETRDKLDDASRGYIGATVVNVSDDAKELYNMPEGAFVYSVTEGSAADAAGIKKGDIITKIDGDSVSSQTDLLDKISYYKPGETITLEIQTANDGQYVAREVEVTLQEGTVTEEDSTEKEEEEDSQTY
jgi:serine protease Do